jgi:hypothetical protein
MFGLQPVTPVIVKVVPEATPQVTVVDVIVDTLGLVGVIAAGSLVLGGVLGAALIGFKHWREKRAGGSLPSEHTALDLSSPSR